MYTNAYHYDLQLSEQFLSLKELNYQSGMNHDLKFFTKSKRTECMCILSL